VRVEVVCLYEISLDPQPAPGNSSLHVQANSAVLSVVLCSRQLRCGLSTVPMGFEESRKRWLVYKKGS